MNNTNEQLLVLGAVAAALIVAVVVVTPKTPGAPSVTALDVGQGDATLIQSRAGRAVLVDGGRDRSTVARLGEVLPPWQRSLDAVLLTHPDADHLDGLIPVIEEYDVGWVGLTGVVDEKKSYRAFLRLLEEKAVPVVVLESGDQILLEDVAMTILSPKGMVGANPQNTNATSLVVVLTYGGEHKALLMGDAERDIEYELLREGLIPDVEILKVGHHGSRFATSNALLRATTPNVALVSAGANNRYGHPALTVVQRLFDAGSAVLNTAEQGTLQFFLHQHKP